MSHSRLSRTFSDDYSDYAATTSWDETRGAKMQQRGRVQFHRIRPELFDGTNANWGTEHDISKCKEECSKRIECGGFLTDFSSGVCGNWQRTPVQLTQQSETNKACYMKQEGKKLVKENS